MLFCGMMCSERVHVCGSLCGVLSAHISSTFQGIRWAGMLNCAYVCVCVYLCVVQTGKSGKKTKKKQKKVTVKPQNAVALDAAGNGAKRSKTESTSQAVMAARCVVWCGMVW